MQRIVLLLLFVAPVAFSMDKVDISGLDKIELVKALYDRAKVQGMGICQQHSGSLSDSEVSKALAKNYIDYLNGRVMKVDLSGDSLDTWLYNRDNGPEAAEIVIQKLRGASKK